VQHTHTHAHRKEMKRKKLRRTYINSGKKGDNLVQSIVCRTPPGQRRKRSMSGRVSGFHTTSAGAKTDKPTHTSKAERASSPTHRLSSSPDLLQHNSSDLKARDMPLWAQANQGGQPPPSVFLCVFLAAPVCQHKVPHPPSRCGAQASWWPSAWRHQGPAPPPPLTAELHSLPFSLKTAQATVHAARARPPHPRTLRATSQLEAAALVLKKHWCADKL